jgi:hypothetical protein
VEAPVHLHQLPKVFLALAPADGELVASAPDSTTLPPASSVARTAVYFANGT